MKNEGPCPFCGSKQIVIDTPFVELKKNGEYGPKRTLCCIAQRKNKKYEAAFINSEDLDES